MNIQRLAQMCISPLHVQQGLFASLALMITLIAAQQFNHWTQSDDAAQQTQSLHHYVAPGATATALKAQDVALSFQSIDETASVEAPSPRAQSWVF
jgi:hypothetical protein